MKLYVLIDETLPTIEYKGVQGAHGAVQYLKEHT